MQIKLLYRFKGIFDIQEMEIIDNTVKAIYSDPIIRCNKLCTNKK